jgi:hypothetical protein
MIQFSDGGKYESRFVRNSIRTGNHTESDKRDMLSGFSK